MRRYKDMFKLCLWCICFIMMISANVQAADNTSHGSGVFSMQEASGATAEPLNIYYYRPEKWTAERPIVVVFHGVQRNAKEYRDNWIELAEQYNLLVVCPEFSQSKYPGVRYYNMGNISDTDDETGTINPQSQWIFPAINHIISATKLQFNASNAPITLFAHSAGAQLIHRYLLLGNPQKDVQIISANAGWYTMPDDKVDFPYGITNIAVNGSELVSAFRKPVIILLGEQDIKRSKILRKRPLADAQGQNRLERGMNFFAKAKAKAVKLNTPFNWQLITVPNVGHDDVGMARAAAQIIAAK